MKSTHSMRGMPGGSIGGSAGALALVALVAGIVLTILNLGWDSYLAGAVAGALILAAIVLAAVALLGPSVAALRGRGPQLQRSRLALALLAGVIGLVLLIYASSWGLGWLLYPAALVIAVALLGRVVPRRLARGPAVPTEQVVIPAPATATRAGLASAGRTSAGRTRVARVFSVLTLVSLAGGSTVTAALMTWASVAVEGVEERSLALVLLFAISWLPTFVLTWAFGTAAFTAKGTLDPPTAVLAFVAGFLGSLVVVLPVSAVPGGAIVLLAALNVAAIYIVRREFWRAPHESIGGAARPHARPLA